MTINVFMVDFTWKILLYLCLGSCTCFDFCCIVIFVYKRLLSVLIFLHSIYKFILHSYSYTDV